MKKLDRKISGATHHTKERIMQFGGGNFLRAFADWMFDVLNEETDFEGSVVVVKPTKNGDYYELKEQEGLFHLALDGVRKGKQISSVVLVKSISRVIQPYQQWTEYLNLAENPDLRFIVSNTTEAGIRFSDSDQLHDTPPKEFPAKLTIWLYHRFQFFEGAKDKGCIMLPCELIEENGDTLQSTILQYAKHWNLGIKFITWIKQHNHFCNTLVDRIVSGYPKDRAQKILEKVGYEDKLLVASEDYHSWIIQGPKQVQEELPFAKTSLNVQFVDESKSYREMKVRILNGAHTSMVPVGYLSGLRTVKEVMDDSLVSQFVIDILTIEIKATLVEFPEETLHNFIDETLDRFKNPTLKHLLVSISLNSTSKFVSRLLPSLKEYLDITGTLPERIVLALSSLFLFYKGSYNGEEIPINDAPETITLFQKYWEQHTHEAITYMQLVSSLLQCKEIWGEDLNALPGLAQMITEHLRNIHQYGIKEVIKQIENQKSLV